MARKSIAFSMLLLFMFGGAALLLTATWTYASSWQAPSARPSNVIDSSVPSGQFEDHSPAAPSSNSFSRSDTAIATQAMTASQGQTELQKNVENAELAVRLIVQRFFDQEGEPAIDDETTEDRDSRLVGELRQSVEKLFKLRMQSQTARLDDAEAKLKTSRQRLVRRQSLAKQIVERRVNELLNTDETKWSRQTPNASEFVPSQRNQDQTTSRPGPHNWAAPRSPSQSLQKIPNAQSIRWELSFLAAVEKQAVKRREIELAKRNVAAALLSQLELNRLTARKRLLQHQLEEVESRRPIDGLSSDLEVALQTNPVSPSIPTQPTIHPGLVDPMHQVKPGDVLSIFVPHVFDDMDRGATSPGYPIHVKSDGKISLPLIGRLKATGKTALEIEDELKKKYADGTDPIFTEGYCDMISVVVHQVYMPAAPDNSGRGGRPAESVPDKNHSEYQQLLGNWEVVSISGKGGKFMTLDESSKVGDKLMIPHVQAPIDKQHLDKSKVYVKSPFERRWFSDEAKASWTKNDSLFLYLNNTASQNTDHNRMTYRSKDGQKNHFSDSEDPAEFAIYRLSGDELTLLAGDPNDFELSEGQDTNLDSRGSPVKWKWRLVASNYPKDFKLEPDKRQLLVKLRRVDPPSVPALSPVENSETVRPFPVGNKPQRTRFGLVYRNEQENYKEAIAISAVGNVGRIKIVDARRAAPESSLPVIPTNQITVTVHSDPNSSMTFALPATDANDDGEASLFELESPHLVAAMKRDSYTVSFEINGRRQGYEVYQTADTPLAPRLQIIEARQYEIDDERKKIAVANGFQVLPWAAPNKQSEILTKRFPDSLVGKKDFLTAKISPQNPSSQVYVVIATLTPEATKRMGNVQRQIVEQLEEDDFRRLAIVVNGKVAKIPRLNTLLGGKVYSGGSSQFTIDGNFTEAEAKQLAKYIAN